MLDTKDHRKCDEMRGLLTQTILLLSECSQAIRDSLSLSLFLSRFIILEHWLSETYLLSLALSFKTNKPYFYYLIVIKVFSNSVFLNVALWMYFSLLFTNLIILGSMLPENHLAKSYQIILATQKRCTFSDKSFLYCFNQAVGCNKM